MMLKVKIVLQVGTVPVEGYTRRLDRGLSHDKITV